jgi:hypothetical protein
LEITSPFFVGPKIFVPENLTASVGLQANLRSAFVRLSVLGAEDLDE